MAQLGINLAKAVMVRAMAVELNIPGVALSKPRHVASWPWEALGSQQNHRRGLLFNCGGHKSVCIRSNSKGEQGRKRSLNKKSHQTELVSLRYEYAKSV